MLHSLSCIHPDPSNDLVVCDAAILELPLAPLGYQVVVGRDILARCRLLYNGPRVRFRLNRSRKFMTIERSDWQERNSADGFFILPGVFSTAAVAALCAGFERALAADTDSAIRSEAGSIYGARNLLSLWPEAATLWRQPPLLEALAELLGPGFGLVRMLFFDKPPDGTWALPWHKDMTIAVRDNRLPSQRFGKPTRKAGVPHVEAPTEVLNAMATARNHLDDVTEENGPLMVAPGSHRTGREMCLGDTPPQPILVRSGDVLVMRPLLAHCSGRSQPGTRRHRRILHLEFAASAELPDGYAWHDFRPGAD